MKIAIVEDDTNLLLKMVKILLAMGHQVLVVRPGAMLGIDSKEKFERLQVPYVCSLEMDTIVSELNKFGADKILIDHDLNAGFHGGQIAAAMGLPIEKIIGISSGREQPYASKHWCEKETLKSVDLRDVCESFLQLFRQ